MKITRIVLCWLCNLPLTIPSHGICSQCRTYFTKSENTCIRCGLPIKNNRCVFCKNNKLYWHSLIAVSDYAEPLKMAIQQLKFHKKTQLAKMLARLMLLEWRNMRPQLTFFQPDIVIPVPAHKKRKWRRGFNQTELLAKPLADWLSCKYLPDFLLQHNLQHEQKNLSAKERKKQTISAFSISKDNIFIKNKNILLVDDIVTTGATINAISQVLQYNGAKSISVICLCRTL